MDITKAYTIGEMLSQTLRATTFRARRKDSSETVRLIHLDCKRASASDHERFHREVDVIKNLDHENIPRLLDVVTESDAVYLVHGDFHGTPLKSVIREQKRINLPDFLRLAACMAETLQAVHDGSVTHRNITSENVLVDDGLERIALVNFGAAFTLTHEDVDLFTATCIERILPYQSPEQTGRINRLLDYRTDLYSVGVVFYEMLVGSLPFTANDPLELLHAHIARLPPSPAEKNIGIPMIVAQIVMRLLAKNPDERYQSGFGLWSDLELCRERLRDGGEIGSFTLGSRDAPIRFIFPERIYGRQEELGLLISAYDSVMDGPTRLAIIRGPSGIGKTALINEFHMTVLERRGLFVSGKFSKTPGGTPYAALVQALGSLVQHLLMENVDQIGRWRSDLLRILGPNGKILTDLVPELTKIIGAQPALPEVDHREFQNRFIMVVGNFIQLFARESRPLVIALDDLQWADVSSLLLLKAVLAETTTRHLLVVIGIRDDEDVREQDACALLEGLVAEKERTSVIPLKALTVQDAIQFVTDMFRCNSRAATDLAVTIHRKTEGNPFFITQLLRLLHGEGLINYAPLAAEGDGRIAPAWRWNLPGILSMPVMENVADIVNAKFTTLPESARTAVQAASCLGHSFAVDDLAAVMKATLGDIYDTILPALDGGILHCSNNTCHFSHDRIYETVIRSLPEDSMHLWQYAIGKHLLGKWLEGAPPELLYRIADHFNLCGDSITDTAEREEISRLNHRAASLSRSSNAYGAAVHYLRNALQFLAHAPWEQHAYDACLEIVTESAECNYLVGNFVEAGRLFEIALEHARTLSEQVAILSLQIPLLTNQNRYDESIALGLKTLRLMKVRIPLRALKPMIIIELVSIKRHMRNHTIDDLLHLPESHDSSSLAIVDVMEKLLQPTYFSNNPEHKVLMVLIILKMLTQSIRQGNNRYSSYAFMSYGVILSGKFGRYDEALEFGRLALAVNDRFDNQVFKPRIYVLFAGMISHWKQPLSVSIAYLREAIAAGMNIGDLTFTANAITQLVYISIRTGERLDSVIDICRRYTDILIHSKHQEAIDTVETFYRMVSLYAGQTRTTDSYDAGDFSEAAFAERIAGRRRIQYNYQRTKIESLYLFGRYEEAVRRGLAIRRDFDEVVVGVVNVPEYYFYFSLALAADYRRVPRGARRRYRALLRKYSARFRCWAGHCAENYEAQHRLIEAEYARITGNTERAVALYHEAIEAAKTGRAINHEALGNELAARFFLEWGNANAARFFITEAIQCYRAWGCVAKERRLESEWSGHIDRGTITAAGREESDVSTNRLDVNTIFRASQSISGEILTDRLLARLMTIIIEIAGAQYGHLLLVRDEHISIEACCSPDGTPPVIVQSLPADNPGTLPLSIINYVRNSGETVSVGSAGENRLFSDDPYIILFKPRSILCLPLIKQKDLIGILYLENRLTPDAFPAERIDLLTMLSAQAAISLENALLFEKAISAERETEEQNEELASINEELENTHAELMRVNESLLFFKRFADSSGQGMSMADFDGTITYANDALCRMLGVVRPEDLIGRNIHDFRPDELSGMLADITDSLVSTGAEWIGEAKMRAVSGVAVPIIQNIFLLNDNEGKPACFATIINDITERKQADEAIRASETKFKDIANLLPQTVCETDSRGILTYVNQHGYTTFGYSPDDLDRGLNALSMFSAETGDRERAADNFLRLLEGEQSPGNEYTMLRSDGSTFPAIVYSRAVVTDGVAAGARSVVIDITERKKMEEEMIKSSKLESLGVFAGGIAHDFNNFLTAIVGNISLAKVSLNENDEVYGILDDAERACLRTKDLTQQLLTFSKGGMPVKKITDVGALLAESAQFILSGSNIRCDYDIAGDLWSADIDAGQIGQVINNLIINARQAMVAGGSITIAAVNETVALLDSHSKPPGDYVKIRITDQGAGIPEEVITRIFDPYFTTKEHGSGLGLTVSYSIIKKHNGHIYVESTLGVGTSFTIYLPATRSIVSVDKPPLVVSPQMRGRILIMDVDPGIISVAKKMILRMGYSVDVAENGQDAIEMYRTALDRTAPYALVILDITIRGGMGGVEAMRELVKIDPHIIALITSGYSNDTVMANYRDYGFHGIISKPYRYDDLQMAISSALR